MDHNKEQAEIYRIRILNQIMQVANELGLIKLAWLANEAKLIGDAHAVIEELEQMSQ